MKTLPTSMVFNQEDAAKLHDEFAEKEEIISSKDVEISRLRNILELIKGNRHINFNCPTLHPTECHVDINMGGTSINLR